MSSIRSPSSWTGPTATLKDFRHLFSTSMQNAGMPEYYRKYLMGHSPGKAAITTYTHLNELRQRYVEAAVEATRAIPSRHDYQPDHHRGPVAATGRTQSQILIPIAISISFGLMASTILVLLLIPAFYVVLHDSGSPPKLSTPDGCGITLPPIFDRGFCVQGQSITL